MRALLACLLLAAPVLAGCLQSGSDLQGASVGGTPYPYDAEYRTDDGWSHTLAQGPYAMLDVEVLEMPSFDGTRIHMGIFRPDVPEGTRVPVIIDAGPYYGDGDEPADSAQTHRLGGFLIENFVPHGYAVAQVSVRGTGLSGGCVDYLGAKEQRDLDAVVTFLAEQEWANGNVAMIGRSYDGSTPWEAATFGNPHLKTIVPISGISNLQQLHFRNGSAEPRSLMLGTLYYSYGAGEILGDSPYAPEEDPTLYARMACAEGPQHTPMGAAGYATGGARTGLGDPADAYWAERDFAPRVLESYHGSIFYVHGLQDWNVKPAQGVDIYNAFTGPKKALLGQWAHNYPDRPDEHGNLRWDWAEMLLRWFDRELKGIQTDTGPDVEVQDQHGRWRAEPQNAWPPTDALWTPLYPSHENGTGSLVAGAATGSVRIFSPAPLSATGADLPDAAHAATGARVVTFASQPFPEGALLAGQPRLHVTVISGTGAGNLWAELWEVTSGNETIQVGRAQMDLRYRDGGTQAQPGFPATAVVARMEFFPLNARLLPGSHLVLAITGETYVPPDLTSSPLPNPASATMDIQLGDELTVLELPFVERVDAPNRWDVQDTQVKDESA